MSAALTLAPATGTPTSLLTVDLGAVATNLATIRAHTRAEVLAVVKADGFGHGAVAVARTALAHGATGLGATRLEEAWALRAAGIYAPVLSWLNPVDADWVRAADARVAVAVPSLAHLRAIASAAAHSGRTVTVHLHTDVGMSRDGASPTEWGPLVALAARAQRRGLVRVAGLMGHLGLADEPGGDPAGRAAFDRAVAVASAVGLRAPRHLAATAAALTDPASHHDLVRVGAGLVGIDPSGTVALRPAMRLTAPVVQVRDVPAGSLVGYGRSHRTRTATRLALLPVGYADGLPRQAAERAAVLLGGRRRPVVGPISMDQVVVDLGSDPCPVRPGDLATVFGPGDDGEPTIHDWARWAHTLPHAIVTGLGERATRCWLPAGAHR